MTCRAPSSATTCPQSGTQTGNILAYDSAGQLGSWQNAPSNPTTTATSLYDGEGHRIQQVVTASATTTTTTYVGALEEIATTGRTTTTTTYYGGVALSVDGTLSYTLSDGLGSVSEALTTLGTVSATQLYGPYGAVRYSNGALPGTRAYTGQHADAATGLDYYGARYYDPVAGQFTSADATLAGGLNLYAYVGGNPESATDPSGHMRFTVSDNLAMAKALGQAYGFTQQPDVYFGSPQQFLADTGQFFLGTDTLKQSYYTLFQDQHASTGDKWRAAGAALLTIGIDGLTIVTTLMGDPEVGDAARGADAALLAGDAAGDVGKVGAVATDATDVAATDTTDVLTQGDAVTGQGDVLSLAATNSSDTGETVDLYRAVGVREYNSVMKTGRFNPGTNSLEARQFALSQDDALAYANRDVSKVAILKATIRGGALESFDFSTAIDPNLFKLGVVTVQPGEQSEIFHQALLSIEQVL